jgi:proteasome beta subunit
MIRMIEKENLMKTGTTTVGIVCKDGVILGADKRTTAGGHLVANKKTEKVVKVTDDIWVTTAGGASDCQLLVKLVQAELRLKRMRVHRKATVEEAAHLMSRMVYNNLRKPSMIPGISHFLLGGRDEKGYYVYDIFADGTLTLIDDFVGSGSGSILAYGVLETLYHPEMTIDQGVALVVKALNAAMQRDIFSGNGLDIIVVNRDGVKKVLEKEVNTGIKV